MKKILKTKVKPIGMKILLIGIVALILVNLLARFNIIDFTTYQSDMLTLIAIFFVAFEIGIMQVIKRTKKVDGLSWFGLSVVGLSFIALVLGWFGMSLAVLSTIKGFIEIALLVFVVIEIFR